MARFFSVRGVSFHPSSLRTLLLLFGGMLICEQLSTVSAEAGLEKLVQIISSVGPEGRGNLEAAEAWRELAARNVQALPSLLNAFDASNDLAANWLRSAIETIVGREIERGGTLPVEALEEFLLDTTHRPKPRRFAFELIAKVDPQRGENLLAGMVNDPGAELRHAAIAREIQRASKMIEAGETSDGKALLRRLLVQAREAEQVDRLVQSLSKLGENVDVATAFGFVMKWKVAGPFDSVGGKGFAATYPPELSIDLNAAYQGKTGLIRWGDFTGKDEHGNVNMNLPFTPLKGAAAYAYTEFFVPTAQPAELRLGSENAFKVWVNGQFVFGQEEYHRNKAIDQYPMPVHLQPGRNLILVKVCQNEQTEDWADGWDFQLRVCDPLGAPIVSTAVPFANGAAQ